MKNRLASAIGIGVLASVAMLASLPAAAVERGFYVGGFYGQTDSDADRALFANQTALIYNGFGFVPQQSQVSFDAKDSGYGFFGGYRLLRHLAFEGGYTEFGDVSYRDASDGFFDDGTASPPAESWTQSTSRSMTAITLSALGILPLSYRSELFVRGGVQFTNTKVRARVSDGQSEISGETQDSDTDWLVGIGAGFTFAEIYTLRLEYQRVFDAGDPKTGFTNDGLGEADIDMLSVGFTVSF